MSGPASWFYRCWDSCGQLVPPSVTHIFSRKQSKHTQQQGISAVGCLLVLLQKTVGTTSQTPYLCFFHVLKYRRFPLDMRKHFYTVRMLRPQLTAVLWQTSQQMLFFQAFLTETYIGNHACSSVVPSLCQQRTVHSQGSSPPTFSA